MAQTLKTSRVPLIAACVLLAGVVMIPSPWLSLPAALVLILWLPGWQLTQALPGINRSPGRCISALAASLVLMAVPLDWLWHVTNQRWAVLATVVAINALLLLLPRAPHDPLPSRPMLSTPASRLGFLAIAGWTGVWVFGSIAGPSMISDTALPSAHDYIKHHAVLWSLERYPLPLHNLFSAIASDQPYYYYEYHYLVPAAIRTLTDNTVSIPIVFGFTSALVAVALISLVYLIAMDLLHSPAAAMLAMACTSVVGGWDILAVLARVLTGHSMVITLDAWCVPVAWRIHNLGTQYMWCPQHCAALLALVFCCWWLRLAGWTGWWLIIAPLAGASLFGSSAYLAITVFIAAGLYVLSGIVTVPTGQSCKRIAGVAVICVLGTALMAVQAMQYLEMSRRFSGGLVLLKDRSPCALLGRLAPAGPIANMLDAPFQLLVDLGLPALALLLCAGFLAASLRRHEGLKLLATTSLTGTIAMLCWKSRINEIDYAFRAAIMPLSILGSIATGALLAERPAWLTARAARALVFIGVGLGLPVGVYEMPMMTLRHAFHLDRGSALDWSADAGAIRFLRDQTPRDAVVQGDGWKRVALGALTNRQMGFADPDNPHVSVFRPAAAKPITSQASVIGPPIRPKELLVYESLMELRVTHVLIGRPELASIGTDSAFRDPTRFRLLYHDDAAAVYEIIPQSGVLPESPHTP